MNAPKSQLIERSCKWCGKLFMAKRADVKRGWAKCCSKSCSASLREKKLDRFGFQRGESGTFDSRFCSTGQHEFSDAHLFSNEEHDCNKG